jgi:predicted RNA-binding Zn-ribbon protein involved in translation (DUF1610 family)
MMQHVYTARDAMDAHFVRGLLEQAGLRAVVQGESLQETWGGLSISDANLPTVWVEDSDVEQAVPIVQQYRETDRANADDAVADAPRATWACPNCGENVEVQFDRCWKCGHERPPSDAALA